MTKFKFVAIAATVIAVIGVSMTVFVGRPEAVQNHNTLWCDKDPGKKLTHNLVRQGGEEKGTLKFLVKWGGKSGGATLSSVNLAITNGTCKTCPPLGEIGGQHPEGTWIITISDVKKPVTLAWNTEGTKRICGDGSLLIPVGTFPK